MKNKEMQLQSKIQRKDTTNKLTLKIIVQGKKVQVTGSPALLASLINKLNKGNNQKKNKKIWKFWNKL